MPPGLRGRRNPARFHAPRHRSPTSRAILASPRCPIVTGEEENDGEVEWDGVHKGVSSGEWFFNRVLRPAQDSLALGCSCSRLAGWEVL